MAPGPTATGENAGAATTGGRAAPPSGPPAPAATPRPHDGSGDAGPGTGGCDPGDAGGGGTGGDDAAAGGGGDGGGDAGAPLPAYTADFLVFVGDGTWGTEVGDVEALFTAHGATFQEASSAQLDAMSAQDMASFGVIYIPGGEGGTEAASVSAATHANLRAAVQQLGASYVGFCAGAFVAVAPAPPPGGDVSYGFGVVDGPVLDYYTGPGSDQTYAMTLESYPDGTSENILWYGGPVTPNTGVVARYPTGEPAISQIRSGNGLVLIGGVHPDLSQGSLDALGVTPDTPSQDIAWKVLQAALSRTPLSTF
jgi:hypothetical protein